MKDDAVQQSIRTLNSALEELKNGRPDEAWKIARKDQLLGADVTKEGWLAFARLALEKREQNT